MPPAINNIIVMIEKSAPRILLKPHASNLLANGRRINEISNAKLMGIRIDLARIKMAKIAIVEAIAKNIR